jgi:hypothetical protein
MSPFDSLFSRISNPSCAGAITIACVMFLQGCATGPSKTSKEIDVVSASDVIDLLKAEMAKVHISPQKVTGDNFVCGNASHQVIVAAVPTSATVALKAVTTVANSATGGVTIPVLSVQVGPAYTYTDTRAVTQIVTYDFNIAHTPLTESDLTDDIKTLRGKLEVTTNALSDAQSGFRLGTTQKEFLAEQIKNFRSAIYSDEEALVLLQQRAGNSSPTPLYEKEPMAAKDVKPIAVRAATIKSDDTLSNAIETAAGELVKVNHTMLPCLKPQDFKVEFDFDVQRKKDGVLTLTVVIWKAGVERAKTSEAFHSILVTFDTTQGSSTTTLLPM